MSVVGIDISDSSIKIVHLAGPVPHALQSYCWEAIPEGVVVNGVIQKSKELKNLLTRALVGCDLRTPEKRPVVASISETQSFLRVVQLPMMEEEEVGEAVQWEVAQHIPFGLENVYLDWELLPKNEHAAEGMMEVLVGASQKKVVDTLYAVMSELGLDVAAFELESQAIVRALISPDLDRKQGLLIVDLGGTSTNVVVHDHGALRFTASLQKGVQTFFSALPSAEAAVLKGPPKELKIADKNKLSERLRPLQEELVTEIRGIVEFYNSVDVKHRVQEIILTGGGANLPGFDEVFVRYFNNVHVQRGNPWANLITSRKRVRLPMSLMESVHFSTALGLALRPVVV
jgi:type IV pilus assembly protein PilM